MAPRSLRRISAVVALAVVSLAGGLLSANESSATTPACVADQATSQAGVKFDNCSGLAPATLLALLNHTDAAAEGNIISASDEFFANQQWLGWVDRHDSPGVLRGLWPIDSSGSFIGQSTNGNYRSLIYPYTGYDSSNAPYGYRGLHTEIYQTPNGQFWTYKNGPQSGLQSSSAVTSSVISRSYATTLVNFTTGLATYTSSGANKATANLTWSPTYNLSASTFNITVTLSATADVQFQGDLGGALLLVNPVCKRIPDASNRYGGCITSDVVNTGLHVVRTSTMATDLCGPPGSNCDQYANATDRFVCFTSIYTPDCYTQDPPPAMAFRPTSTSTYGLIATPSWNETGPVTPQTMSHKFAYHFNSMPLGDRVLSGWGSIDTVEQGNAQQIGPNSGTAQFGVNLSH